MKDVNFNELAKRAFENAKAKGFHDEMHTDGHWLMLVMCELAEAVEAERCGKRADRKEYERLVGACEERLQPHLFEMYIKDTVEDELADAVIRLLDFMGMKGTDVLKRLSDAEISMDDFGKGEKTGFAEEGYKIIEMFFFDKIADFMMYDIFCLANKYDIDLMWHINEKMKYNENRERKHGKAY